MLPDASGAVLGTSVLVLTNVQHSATYTCLAQSHVGYIWTSAHVTVSQGLRFLSVTQRNVGKVLPEP